MEKLILSDEEWKQVMDVNVMAHVYAARRLVPEWVERGEGYFVSTASAAVTAYVRRAGGIRGRETPARRPCQLADR